MLTSSIPFDQNIKNQNDNSQADAKYFTIYWIVVHAFTQSMVYVSWYRTVAVMFVVNVPIRKCYLLVLSLASSTAMPKFYFTPIQAVSFVENIKNVTRFAEIMSIFSGELSAMAKVAVFLMNKQIFRNILSGLQLNVDESVYCTSGSVQTVSVMLNNIFRFFSEFSSNRGKRFEAANVIAERIATVDLIAMVHTIVLLCLGPAANIAYHYFSGQLSAEHLLLPAEGQ